MKTPLLEILLFLWADEHNVSSLFFDIYDLVGEQAMLGLLQKYAGTTVTFPLPSEFKKMLVALDVYNRYNALITKPPSNVDKVLYAKQAIETIADETGFTSEDIIDIIEKMQKYTTKAKSLFSRRKKK